MKTALLFALALAFAAAQKPQPESPKIKAYEAAQAQIENESYALEILLQKDAKLAPDIKAITNDQTQLFTLLKAGKKDDVKALQLKLTGEVAAFKAKVLADPVYGPKQKHIDQLQADQTAALLKK